MYSGDEALLIQSNEVVGERPYEISAYRFAPRSTDPGRNFFRKQDFAKRRNQMKDCKPLQTLRFASASRRHRESVRLWEA